jgi:putative serine protease PepD
MIRIAVLAAAAVLIAGVVSIAGCDDDSTSQASPVVREPASVAALNAQLVKIVKDVSPTVVQVQCGRSLGSGVVFDGRGDVVTNAHVVDGASACQVTLAGGDVHTASVVGSRRGNDVAVVRLIDARPGPATFANSNRVRVGEMTLAMGNPLGLRSSVTQGIVSSLNRDVAESSRVELSELIQTSAEINPGNSGGALVDMSGRVIGIPTLTALDPEFGDAQAPGIGFAIPSNVVRSVASSLIAAS